MNSSDRVKKAHIAIMRHKKFCAFSGLLACGKTSVHADLNPPTAYTDGWNTKYHDGFVASLSDPELRMLILHEQTHKAYRHTYVWRDLWKEDPRLANIAADMFVNISLIDTDAGEGFVKMPKDGVHPDPQYRGMNVKQIFDAMKQKQEGDEGDEGDDGDGGMDHHDWEGEGKEGDGKAMTEVQKANEIERAMRQGEMIRKRMAGTGTGNADGVFGELLTPVVDWRKVLRDFVTEHCAGRDESSWRRPNRRYLGMDVYMPTLVGTTLPELVVGFDVSGSVFGSGEMTRFVTELTTIIEQIKPSKCHVVYWDTQVCGHQTFEDGQFAVQDLKIRGGGGTDGSVLFDYLRDKRITPTAIVQFTDGYVGSWGTSDCPTLWAITTDIVAPYGVTIKIDV